MADNKEAGKVEVAGKERSPGVETREEMIARKRQERIPPGVPSLSLDYPIRDGFTRRVICDRQGRLERFEGGGWDFVTQGTLYGENPADRKVAAREGVDSRVSQVVGTHKDGSPMRGYLMEIPTELYDEDQALKMNNLDRLEEGFRRGVDQDGSGGVGKDGRYIPKNIGISIKHGQRRP